jgi:hypothetical protein
MIKKPRSKKKFIISTLALLGIAAATVGWFLWHDSRQVDTSAVSSKHFSGPTQQEKDEAANHKDELVQQMNDEKGGQGGGDTNSDGKKAVTPIITDASQSDSQVRISGYVSGVFEDGGTCTITITQGSSKIVKTATAFENVSTTQCSPVTLQRSDFPAAGQWQVTLAYNSAAAEGTSQAQALAIQ